MKKLILLSFFILVLLVVVSAEQPPIQVSEEGVGLTIVYPQNLHYASNSSFCLNFDVLNSTNGKVNNETAYCNFYIFDGGGKVIYKDNMTYLPSYRFWYINLSDSKGNFTNGHYPFYVWCDDEGINQQGWVSLELEVLGLGGEDISEGQAILYACMLLVIILAFVVLLYLAVSLDGENYWSMGRFLKVNFNKYIKIGLYFLAYDVFVLILFFVWQVSTLFFILTDFTGVLYVLFMIALFGIIPCFILVVLVGIVKVIADVDWVRMAERGLKPR